MFAPAPATREDDLYCGGWSVIEVDAESRRRNDVRFSLLQFASEVGVVRDVREHIEWLSAHVLVDDEKSRLKAFSLYLKRMEKLEEIYGPGSCINLKHEFVTKLVSSRIQYFTAKALANARAVPAFRRMEFLEGAPKPI